jgi:hypothetical protein
MQTWTFGPAGIYTATWDGVSKVTVTLTAGGAFVASFFAQSLTAAVASPEYQAILNPAPSLPALDYYTNQQLAAGEGCTPRLTGGNAPVLASGVVQFTYWTAAKTETCNTIITNTGGTAAAATPTYCAAGIYSVDASGNLTELAQCANDTTLWAATFTQYNRALTTPFNKVAGQRYAFALLCITGAATPNFFGYNGTFVMASTPPVLCTKLTGQASLPASVPAGSLAGTSGMYFGAITP